eukprot:6490539-Amphidinium_carterae.1
MRLLLTIAIIKKFTVFTTDIASAFLNTPIDEEVLALYGLRTSPKQWQEHLSTILQRMGLKRLKSDACIFANKQSSVYLMAYVDDLLVVGDTVTQQFLQQFQQHFKRDLELKHTTQLTRSTSLEFLGLRRRCVR